jgi:hypothetical protein
LLIPRHLGLVRKAEAKRAAFRVQYVDLLPDASSGSSRLDAARNSAPALQGRLTDAIAKRDDLRRELPTTPPLLVTETDPGTGTGTAAPDGGLAEARAHLREPRNDGESVWSVYLGSSP